MKNIFLIIILGSLITSCNTTKHLKQSDFDKLIAVNDSLIKSNEEISEIALKYKSKFDSISSTNLKYEKEFFRLQTENNSLSDINLVLSRELTNCELMVQNARYYTNIANKNSSQRQFLLGWLNRVLEIK